jgi:hypothetical protein
MQQIVIFTGPTGVEKKVALRAVTQEYFNGKIPDVPSLSTDEFFNDSEVQRYIRYFSLEDEVKNVHKKSITILLDEEDPEIQRNYWKQGWKSLLQKRLDVPPNVSIFIALHLSYFRRQKRFILHDPKDILQLNPDCFVTLIDDVYAIYFRIKEREKKRKISGSYLRLQDILEWRNLEVNLSDCFANSLERKNFIVPVKHPTCTLNRLIFDRDNRALIYAAYPISKPRHRLKGEKIPIEGDFRTEGQKEMDSNRLTLYQSPNIIFDPITIDERALQFSFQSVYGDDSIYSVPGGCLFSIGKNLKDLENDLNKGDTPKIVKDTFETKGILLSEEITISSYPLSKNDKNTFEWKLTDEKKNNIYIIVKEGDKLNIYPEDISNKFVKLEKHHRWPLVFEGFPPMVQDPPDLFPLDLPAEEIHSIIYCPRLEKGGNWKSLIDTQIEIRDFSFIRNAKCIAAYRPMWKGELNEGVKTEVKYASGKILRIVYWPEEDNLEGRSPFAGEYDEAHKNSADFYKTLNELNSSKIGGKKNGRRANLEV